jgi:hypothetical protein
MQLPRVEKRFFPLGLLRHRRSKSCVWATVSEEDRRGSNTSPRIVWRAERCNRSGDPTSPLARSRWLRTLPQQSSPGPVDNLHRLHDRHPRNGRPVTDRLVRNGESSRADAVAANTRFNATRWCRRGANSTAETPESRRPTTTCQVEIGIVLGRVAAKPLHQIWEVPGLRRANCCRKRLSGAESRHRSALPGSGT